MGSIGQLHSAFAISEFAPADRISQTRGLGDSTKNRADAPFGQDMGRSNHDLSCAKLACDAWPRQVMQSHGQRFAVLYTSPGESSIWQIRLVSSS
jgi:hypothetical protein